jgi:hypothetical protein
MGAWLKLEEKLAETNNIQRSLLIVTIFSILFADIFTWDLVINRGIFSEGSILTANFISQYGTLGLLLCFVLLLMFVILFWLSWVLQKPLILRSRPLDALSKHSDLNSLVFMFLFVYAVTDFANDSMMLCFKSNVLFFFLKGSGIPLLLLLAFVLSIIVRKR